MITVQQKIELLNKLKQITSDRFDQYIIDQIINDDLKFQLPAKEATYIKTIFGMKRIGWNNNSLSKSEV